MVRKLLVVLILAALQTLPCMAQTTNCSLAGSWYGGAPEAGFPYYHLTVTPGSNKNTFALNYQLAVEIASVGYLRATDWTGEVSSGNTPGPQTFQGTGYSIWQWDPNSPDKPKEVDASLPELDFIHQKIEFISCDTIRSTIDLFVVYFNFKYGRFPLYDAPDLVIPGPIVEEYHRIPSDYPSWFPSAGAASPTTAAPLQAKRVPKKPSR